MSLEQVGIEIRQEQKLYLDTLHNRMTGFQQKAQAKLDELKTAFEEALVYVKKDLGVALDVPHAIQEFVEGGVDTTERKVFKFVPVPKPEPAPSTPEPVNTSVNANLPSNQPTE